MLVPYICSYVIQDRVTMFSKCVSLKIKHICFLELHTMLCAQAHVFLSNIILFWKLSEFRVSFKVFHTPLAK
jgi:hypothetical protein